ncbi:hypothetical protein NMY22_g16318 [Coprinellus aureogranulatus]|nr:hypothetical protein NMY22_g16318 [Coprinellus aureogranulatus]
MASPTKPSESQRKSSPQPPTAKPTAIGRLKSFTGSITPKREKKPKLQFPPPSWNIEDYHTSPPSPASTPSRTPSQSPPLLPSDQIPTPAAPNGSSPAEEHVEPVSFAMRLRSMIESLPIPGMGSAPSTPPATEMHSIPSTSAESPSPPLPPDMDPNLVKILSSEEIMNGDAGGDGKSKNPSIWNILAGLGKTDKGSGKDEANIPSPVEAEDSGGIMMYAPLEPKADSRVSLAEAEVIHEEPPKTELGKAADKLRDILHGKQPSAPAEKRVWVPSTTELSVLTAWWGYRLYLPPPVMAKLGASSVKAAARAAMVTSALKWMLDSIPLAVVPPQFRAAVKMLRTLAPIASYVGVFIAWSWDRIKALDEGSGVVLTATWLLPVALLPMAWDAGTIYRPILYPSPEEIQKAEEEAREAEENENGKSSKVKDGEGGGEPGKDKKKNKSKFKFW